MGGTGSKFEDNIITDFLNDNYGLSMKYIPYKGGGAVAKDVAGKQINSSVNNPSEALGFYESGDMIALVAFTDERLPMFPDVPTLREKGVDFSYFMQRSVVGAPGMSDEAEAYYATCLPRFMPRMTGRTIKARSHSWVNSCLVMS